MAVNLKKGQRVSIDNTLNMVLVGLGWDINRYASGGDFDLDAEAFLLGADGKVPGDSDFIYYGNLSGRNGAVVHQGDNRTGEGEGDDEVILIDFSKVPQEVDKIVVTVTIYESADKSQNFGQVSNAYVRVAKVMNEFDTDGETVIRFDLDEEFSIETALVVCEIYRRGGEWKFNAVGAGYQGGLEALCRNYGVSI